MVQSLLAAAGIQNAGLDTHNNPCGHDDKATTAGDCIIWPGCDHCSTEEQLWSHLCRKGNRFDFTCPSPDCDRDYEESLKLAQRSSGVSGTTGSGSKWVSGGRKTGREGKPGGSDRFRTSRVDLPRTVRLRTQRMEAQPQRGYGVRPL